MYVLGACGRPFDSPPSALDAGRMHPVAALRRLGGVADRPTLLRLTTRRRLRTAVARSEVIRTGRNRYTLPTAGEGIRAAGRLSAVASHRTAAALHGWELAHQPERPEVIVPRGRKIDAGRRAGVDVRWRRRLEEHEVYRGAVTEAHRTVLDCARDLPFAEALAVADSALRSGQVDHDRLVTLCGSLSTTGRTTAMRVIGAADGRAANPFESVLRAIAIDVPGLDVEPQVLVQLEDHVVRPDLVDRRRRVVLEADSFEWHGSRSGLVRDCRRYNDLVLAGWTVLRFSWEHVMLHGDYVRDSLLALGHRPRGRTAVAVRLPDSA